MNEQQIKKLEEQLNQEVDSKKEIELKLNEVGYKPFWLTKIVLIS